MRDGARICLSCGEMVRTPVATGDRLAPAAAGVPSWIAFEPRHPNALTLYPAGRLQRIVAALVDGLVISVVAWIVGLALGEAVATVETRGGLEVEYAVNWRALVPLLVFQCAYYVAFPATSLQGTPGKKLLGLRITTLEEGQLNIFQSAMRFVFQQAWLIVGVPLTLVGVSNSPWAGLFPFLAVIATGVAFWVLCGNGRSPWDWMASTRVVE